MEDREAPNAQAVVRSVREWPVEHLRRAHRLSAHELHRAIAAGDPDRIGTAEEESMLFAGELLRRGLI